jgi:dynein light intermediate chain 2
MERQIAKPFAAPHNRHRSSGKTTLISSFLDIDLSAPAKPTLGIECDTSSRAPSFHHSLTTRYKFARRSNAADGSMKDIAHIWEIAGGLTSLDLLKVIIHHSLNSLHNFNLWQVPLTVQSAASSAIAIVMSLARPAGVYSSTRAILERVKETIAAVDIEARAAAGDKRRSALEKAREKVLSKLADHPDAKEKRILVCGVCVPQPSQLIPLMCAK